MGSEGEFKGKNSLNFNTCVAHINMGMKKDPCTDKKAVSCHSSDITQCLCSREILFSLYTQLGIDCSCLNQAG